MIKLSKFIYSKGKEEEVKLAFPIRMELQNRITKLLPSKLDAFRNHVQDLDDEMNKMVRNACFLVIIKKLIYSCC